MTVLAVRLVTTDLQRIMYARCVLARLAAVFAVVLGTGCEGATPSRDVDAAALPDAISSWHCDMPDALLPPGTIVGMDATHLFIRGPDGALRSWPKAGGPTSDVVLAEARAHLTVSGTTYYWWSERDAGLLVTDASGQTLAKAYLASPTNRILDVVQAPDDGVFIRTRCTLASTACDAPTPPDTIEHLTKNSTVAQTVVTASDPIHMLASAGDALVWLEHASTFGVIKKWQPSAGVTSTLVDSIDSNADGADTLAVVEPYFYYASATEPRALQRRRLDSGALVATLPGSVVHHLRVSAVSDRYYSTVPARTTLDSAGSCERPPQLVMHTLSGAISIEGGLDEAFFVDESRLYFRRGDTRTCCTGHGTTTCSPTNPQPGPPQLRCYYQQ